MTTLLGLFGYIGVTLLLLAYFMLTIGQMKATDMHHTVLNMLGALFIVIAMHTDNPVPLFVTLLLWLCISIFGMYKHHLEMTE